MRRQQNNLPGLRAAAVVFLAARAAEGKIFCATSRGEVVPESNCENTKAPGTFYMIRSDQELPLGSAIPPETEMNDSFYPIDRANARFPPDIEYGGFGKRQLDCDDGTGG
ncbi:hypothetical protein C8034_v004154 [Colletotrichum sidae]|uniref:Uncharacterized protein n=2 Tax=Colletotrichum orbiculare species complex TaxID=2707354 RepID=N4W2A5_COLOR|nr:hypothetical protein Cob_v009011 [Colletotrichum orbiculare MAFF 240422]TEA13535.1 hypothetical protein C8034_v004154 [Colletotrichum sidae]